MRKLYGIVHTIMVSMLKKMYILCGLNIKNNHKTYINHYNNDIIKFNKESTETVGFAYYINAS